MEGAQPRNGVKESLWAVPVRRMRASAAPLLALWRRGQEMEVMPAGRRRLGVGSVLLMMACRAGAMKVGLRVAMATMTMTELCDTTTMRRLRLATSRIDPPGAIKWTID